MWGSIAATMKLPKIIVNRMFWELTEAERIPSSQVLGIWNQEAKGA